MSWRNLRGLTALQELLLEGCSIQQLPAALSQLTMLTSLSIRDNDLSALAPLAALRPLEQLDLSWCELAAVPEQLSALTALTRLSLSWNRNSVGGWHHLIPLTRLRSLALGDVPLPDGVPPEVTALPALTHLYPETLRF